MDGAFNVTTLVFLVIAVVIFLKLRSVLGRRTGDEQTRFERYKAQQEARQSAEKAAGQDKVITLPRRERDEADARPAAEARPAAAAAEERVKNLAGADSAVAKGLLDILRSDSTFEPDGFLKGAKAAYEIIVTAFAEGNRRTLKDLLSREVFDGFAAAISDREGRGEAIDQSFVGMKSADIVEAELKADMAHITVKFVSELITATRDRSGEVISGDPKRIKEVTDIWTFAREVSSRNPNWRLVATQAAN